MQHFLEGKICLQHTHAHDFQSFRSIQVLKSNNNHNLDWTEPHTLGFMTHLLQIVIKKTMT